MSFRIEEKLLIGTAQLPGLHRWLDQAGAQLLHPKRRIFSTYFDTDDYALYIDSEEGSVPRKKIRVRSYNADNHGTDGSQLEVKISSVEGRFKTTKRLDESDTHRLLAMGYYDADYGNCVPVVNVAYDREYFAVHDVRLTIDTGLCYTSRRSRHSICDELTAVEIKAPHRTSMNALTTAFPFRRTRFSKYSRAVSAVRRGSAAWL